MIMFNRLRLQLSLLYTIAAFALIVLVGGGSYLIVARYFAQITDLALQHKMAHEFVLLGAPLPAELAAADRDWSLLRAEVASGQRPPRQLSSDEALAIAQTAHNSQVDDFERKSEDGRIVYKVEYADGYELRIDASSGQIMVDDEHSDDDDDQRPTPSPNPLLPAAYEGELAAIYVLPVSSDGRLLFDPNPNSAPQTVDEAALAAALADGSDLRTISNPDGAEIRLLTYRLTRSDGPSALQLGRVLSDQQVVLNQLLLGSGLLALFSTLLISIASWWLAGRALRPANAAWARQQEFIAGASHELRSPLTLIRASTEVALRATPSNAHAQRTLLGDVLTDVDHMAHLVDDLLTLTRLDAGQLPLKIESIALDLLFAELSRQLELVAAERSIQILACANGLQIQADPTRLGQILLITLDNALRYSPVGGKIELSAKPESQMVQIEIRDEGAGIAADQLERIFERFYRADHARCHAGNAGLGLAIARALAEAQGGNLSASSPSGSGAIFALRLPITR